MLQYSVKIERMQKQGNMIIFHGVISSHFFQYLLPEVGGLFYFLLYEFCWQTFLLIYSTYIEGFGINNYIFIIKASVLVVQIRTPHSLSQCSPDLDSTSTVHSLRYWCTDPDSTFCVPVPYHVAARFRMRQQYLRERG